MLSALNNIIYLSIFGIYVMPLQGNYSEALPAHSMSQNDIIIGLFILVLQTNYYF